MPKQAGALIAVFFYLGLLAALFLLRLVFLQGLAADLQHTDSEPQQIHLD